MMKKIFITFALLLSGTLLFAQEKALKANYFSKAVYMHEIPALSKMDNIIAAKGFEHVAPPKRRGKNTFVPGKGTPNGIDPLVQKQRNVQRTPSRAPLASFGAHAGTVLNDPTGAIGPNHYVYAFNSGFGILDRSGNVLVPEASLATIFPNETLGDPIVVYDHYAGRFIIMEFSNSPNGVLIAVCKGADPVNDGWYTYRFNTGTFPDYEKLSVWHDGYYITANKDQGSASTSQVVYAVERDKMLTGNTGAQMVGFPLPGISNNGFYSPGGFSSVGPNLPPAGTPHPIVFMQDDSWSGVSNDHLKIWNVSVNWSNTSSSTISQPQSINTTAFDCVFNNGSFNNLDEPGSGPNIDAIQSTMMYMTNYRRFGTHNSAVMNFVVDVSGNDTKAGIRWYELRQANDSAPWTIHQEGTYTQPNGHSAFMGSINIDAQGNIGLGYTIVSSSVYTSLRYTGRLASDPLGTMTLAEQTIVNGDTKNNRSDGRFGDYAQLTIDPTDDMTFWYIAEYMKGSSNPRKSHVAAFKVGTGGGGGGDTEAPTTPTNLSASGTTTNSTNLSWTASTDNTAVTGYDVLRNGSVIGSATGTTYTATGLTPATTYSFQVRAKDAAGNVSGNSNTVSVTTLNGGGGGSGCANGITAFPYTESFDSNFGAWTQSTNDNLNWSRRSGGTPSNGTGPSSANDGSHYIYVEASGNGTGYPNKRAILNSPCYDLSAATQASFNFKYHMYGSSNMGSIDLEVSTDNGSTWTSIWRQTGNKGNSWQTASVDLASYLGGSIQLRFNRLTGGTWQADIAIDAINLSTGGGGGGNNCAAANLTLTIKLDNYPEETSWTIKNSAGTTVASGGTYGNQADGSTVTENINGLAAGDYTFTINDSYGDGICCSYGNGNYTLASSAGTIKTGGEFASSESTTFCVDPNKQNGISTFALNDKETLDFEIYPNPATTELNVNTRGHEVNNVQIFSAFGMRVKSMSSLEGKGTIDVSQLPVGTYFIRFVSGDQTVTRKFIKK